MHVDTIGSVRAAGDLDQRRHRGSFKPMVIDSAAPAVWMAAAITGSPKSREAMISRPAAPIGRRCRLK